MKTWGDLFRACIPQRMHDAMFRLSSARAGDRLKHRYAFGLSMGWSLENLKRGGFHPTSIIDVGAFVGDWTAQAHAIWPHATCLMIEPQPNKQERLRGLCSGSGDGSGGGSIDLETALLGAREADHVNFHMDDFGGSSVLEQVQNKCELATSLRMTTLDSLLAARQPLSGPILFKADVQGYELEVLRGAKETLPKVEVVVLEVSLLPYNLSAPLFAEVMAFMDGIGFAVFDIGWLHRRQSDEAVFQADVIFVRHGSALRSEKPFFV